jgi:hypothetical protein
MKKLISFNCLLTILITATAILAQSQPRSPSVGIIHVLSGQVIDNNGKPAGQIRLYALAEGFDESKPNSPIPSAVSDGNGNFTIMFSRTGKYSLVADAPSQGYWSTRMPFFAVPGYVTPEVVVDPATSRIPVTIVLPPRNGVIKGKIIDVKTGLPVESVQFVLCHAANPQICRASVAKSADGLFQIPAAHVPFTLRARADGFSEWKGLQGHDTTPISVPSGSSIELNVFFTRQANAVDKAISEAEKQSGVHLPAPPQLKPDDGIQFNFFPRKTRLEWASVEGAASYSVEIDYCQPDQNRHLCAKPNPLWTPPNLPTTGITTTSYEFNFVGAQPGRWRVWAVDKDGREGFKSSWRMFIYLQ